MGGAYAAALAAAHPDISTLALLAPVAFPHLVFPTFFQAEHRAQLVRYGWMDWLGWPVGAGFMDSLNNLDPLVAFRSAAIPALVIHGTGDQEVAPENAYAYEALGAQRKTIDEADHLFSGVRFKEQLFSLIIEWFLKQCHRRCNDDTITGGFSK
ncbi:hypothetical protein GCM10010911_51740 [Paenibacillus nasutitermitis]|uniref:Peptidase S9 prolyl oligopeptidase catalytic domain-containing protein n=1 Tax=Paenibacillus nasutitermitis TaxID=1652958 RepID=A0A916ZCN8_9BACL|nr:hypothetical protein GCM10010911_51740 [Paenibacillus nasutitermitis]